ncbi:MAG: hypothetical protein ACQES1_03825, partial [Bacteroidota bacterium]
HIVGLHGTYNAYNNARLFGKELDRIKKLYPEISEGRQHYLRFDNPVTWQIWNDYNLKVDSSVGFSDDAGFKAGTCFDYHPFNVLTKEKLALIERPLTVMDTALFKREFSHNEMLELINNLYKTIKSHNGNFVLLWHNNNLTNSGFKSYKNLYENIIKTIHE